MKIVPSTPISYLPLTIRTKNILLTKTTAKTAEDIKNLSADTITSLESAGKKILPEINKIKEMMH